MNIRRQGAAGRGKEPLVFLSRCAQETEAIGGRLARRLEAPVVILLRGALGTGKTTLARGLARGFGLQDPALVHSPSFTIVNVYHGRHRIYHVDLYRLSGERDLRSVGLEDFLGREGVTIVEWGERLGGLGDAAVEVELEDAGYDRRIIRVRGLPPGRRVRAMVLDGVRPPRSGRVRKERRKS